MQMDKESNKTSNDGARSTRRSRSASISASVRSDSPSRVSDQGTAPLASPTSLPQPESAFDDYSCVSLIHGLPVTQGGYPSLSPSSDFPADLFDPGHMEPLPFHPPNSSWQELPAQYSQQYQHFSHHQTTPFDPGMMPFPYDGFTHVPVLPVGSSSTSMGASAAQPVASTSASSPGSAEPTEAESRIIAEDKRIRNTAASARFRIKKKQRTLNLERSVSDLTGRAEELEREATSLRLENSWLKEIVILKSSRFSGVNTPHNPALLQPVQESGQREIGELKVGGTDGPGRSDESSDDGAGGRSGGRNKNGEQKSKAKRKEREME